MGELVINRRKGLQRTHGQKSQRKIREKGKAADVESINFNSNKF